MKQTQPVHDIAYHRSEKFVSRNCEELAIVFPGTHFVLNNPIDIQRERPAVNLSRAIHWGVAVSSLACANRYLRARLGFKAAFILMFLLRQVTSFRRTYGTGFPVALEYLYERQTGLRLDVPQQVRHWTPSLQKVCCNRGRRKCSS